MSGLNENAAVIRVENLLFRKPCMEDVGDLLAVKNDVEAALMLGGLHHQYTADGITNWIDFHNSRDDEAVFVIVDTDTGHLLVTLVFTK